MARLLALWCDGVVLRVLLGRCGSEWHTYVFILNSVSVAITRHRRYIGICIPKDPKGLIYTTTLLNQAFTQEKFPQLDESYLCGLLFSLLELRPTQIISNKQFTMMAPITLVRESPPALKSTASCTLCSSEFSFSLNFSLGFIPATSRWRRSFLLSGCSAVLPRPPFFLPCWPTRGRSSAKEVFPSVQLFKQVASVLLTLAHLFLELHSELEKPMGENIDVILGKHGRAVFPFVSLHWINRLSWREARLKFLTLWLWKISRLLEFNILSAKEIEDDPKTVKSRAGSTIGSKNDQLPQVNL